MSCKEISADWAAQRIKGLSLSTAILNALLEARSRRDNGEVIKTLIDSFRYPRKGPGMMWEACARQGQGDGRRRVRWAARWSGCHCDAADGLWQIDRMTDTAKHRHTMQARHVISSAPMRAAGRRRHAGPVGRGPQAADALKYRDFLTVVLILKDKRGLRRQLDLHPRPEREGRPDPELQVVVAGDGADPSMNCYGLEYFCFEGDGLWSVARTRT